MANSNRLTLIFTKGSGASQLLAEIEGFKTSEGSISIHEITTNQKFKDDLEVMPFNLGHEYSLREIVDHFGVTERYDVADYIENGPTTTKTNAFLQATSVVPFITTAEDDPTSTSPFNITVTFSEPIDDSTFAAGDLTVGNGSAGTPSTSDNQTYTVAITPTGAGAVTVDIPADGLKDAAGVKDNVAADQFSITYTT